VNLPGGGDLVAGQILFAADWIVRLNGGLGFVFHGTNPAQGV
jgi:hypothetical protein